MKKKHHFLWLFLALGLPVVQASALTTSSSDKVKTVNEVTYDGPLTIKLGTRIDYQREYQKSEAVDGSCGFKGKNLMISIQGNINNHFSYRFRQRISETKRQGDFFDGTDYMFLKYNFNNRWDVTGGKVAIEFGNAEYQRDPSAQYILSPFWNYPPCYKFGVNLGFNATANDRLVLQAAESSFKTPGTDLYAYALSWYGNHQWFHTMYSANAMEYRDGKFVYMLCLGHQLDFGKVLFNLDYINRVTGKKQLAKDYTLRGEIMIRPNDRWNIIGLATHNRNKNHDFGGYYLKKGTELSHFGGVVEFTPIPAVDQNLKFHAAYCYYYGQEGVKGEVPDMNRHFFSIGAQWEVDIVALAKKIWNKK